MFLKISQNCRCQPVTLLKKRLWHKCFPVNFAKFLRTQPATLLKEKLWRKCFPVNSANLLRTPLLQSTSSRLLLKKKEKTKIFSFMKCKVYFSCFKQKQPKEVFYKSKIIFTIFFATWVSLGSKTFPSYFILFSELALVSKWRYVSYWFGVSLNFRWPYCFNLSNSRYEVCGNISGKRFIWQFYPNVLNFRSG